jgi:hypothetical protein
MRHSDLVDLESGRGEKRRQHRSVGEAFQQSSGSKDAEQDGAINFVRALNQVVSKHSYFLNEEFSLIAPTNTSAPRKRRFGHPNNRG